MKACVNGIELFYEKRGGGFPLLLLHGNGEDHHIFDELAAKLEKDFTVYAIDSRNHGLSAKTDSYSYDEMADDIYCFICELNLGAVGIVGFSDGAILSLMLALKHRKVIKKMVLLGANLTPRDFTRESMEYVKDAYARAKDPLFKLMLEQPDIDPGALKTIDIPSLVVGAENDIFRPGTFEKIAAALPDSRLKIMKGHNHDSYVSHKDILYPDIAEFFKN